MSWRRFVPAFAKRAYRGMSLGRFVPAFAKRAYRGWKRAAITPFCAKDSATALHAYWRRPDDGLNHPESYLHVDPSPRTYVANTAAQFLPMNAKILEIGCGVGSNLDLVHQRGFKGLTGVDINADALKLFSACFPTAAASTTIHHGAIEDAIPRFQDRLFDFVFSIGVLQHIHYDHEWIFPHLARIGSRYLLTIEEEYQHSKRKFPRDYQRVFEPLGFRQCREDAGASFLGPGFWIARLFQRA